MNYKKIFRTFFKYTSLILLLFLLYKFYTLGIFASGAARYKESAISQAAVRPIVIAGDLQKTSFIEKCMGRESNDRERILLIKEMVFDGSNRFEWKDFDL